MVSIERRLAMKAGDAKISKIILQLGLLEPLDRIPRFPDERRCPGGIGGSPAQQHVAVFEIDRAEGGSIGRTAVAVLDRNILPYRLQFLYRAAISWSAPNPSARACGQDAPAANPIGMKARAPKLAERRRPPGRSGSTLRRARLPVRRGARDCPAPMKTASDCGAPRHSPPLLEERAKRSHEHRAGYFPSISNTAEPAETRAIPRL